MASLTAARKAHLLFSPNVLRRTVLCLALEASSPPSRPFVLVRAEDLVDAVELRLLKGAHSLAWWSSCRSSRRRAARCRSSSRPRLSAAPG